MKKFKDFLYDKNDIIIALCILVVAGLLIVWRIDSIMQYPETLAKETHTVDTKEDHAVQDSNKDSTDKSDKEDKADKDKSEETSNNSQPANSGVWSGDSLARDVTVTVSGGSASGAVQCLIDAGLFDSYEEYESICSYQNIVPENIKATTFTFPAGSTKADIAIKVTQ